MNRMAVSAYTAISQRIHEIKEMDRERGLTTTEIAVLTFVLVTVAVAIGALLYSYASDRVEALPENPATEARILGDDSTN